VLSSELAAETTQAPASTSGSRSPSPCSGQADLADELKPLRDGRPHGHPWAEWARAEAHMTPRLPGAWAAGTRRRTFSWTPLRPELVCEVTYEHIEGFRFRDTAHFQRWRADHDPRSWTSAQLEAPVRYDLAQVLSVGCQA